MAMWWLLLVEKTSLLWVTTNFWNESSKGWGSNQSHSPEWKTPAFILHALLKNDSAAENNCKKEMCSGYKFICCIINIVYQKIWSQGIYKSSNPRTMSTASYHHRWRHNKQCWSVCIKRSWRIFWQRFLLLLYCPRSKSWQFCISKQGKGSLWHCSIKQLQHYWSTKGNMPQWPKLNLKICHHLHSLMVLELLSKIDQIEFPFRHAYIATCGWPCSNSWEVMLF